MTSVHPINVQDYEAKPINKLKKPMVISYRWDDNKNVFS